MPSVLDGTHTNNPGNPPQRSAPGSTGSPSVPPGPAPSGCPTVAASHSPSRCKRVVPLAAGSAWRAEIPVNHPEIPSPRRQRLRSVRSSPHPHPVRLGWRAPAPTPLPACPADKSGHTTRRTGTSAPAWPFGPTSVSEERVFPAAEPRARCSSAALRSTSVLP